MDKTVVSFKIRPTHLGMGSLFDHQNQGTRCTAQARYISLTWLEGEEEEEGDGKDEEEEKEKWEGGGEGSGLV